jgi:hypothetical protein
MKTHMRTFLVLTVLSLLGVPASADSIWTYSGNTQAGSTAAPVSPGFDSPCDCPLTGSVTLDAAGNVVAWDFTGGILTLTNLNSTGQFMFLFSDGTISRWDILLAVYRLNFISGRSSTAPWPMRLISALVALMCREILALGRSHQFLSPARSYCWAYA